MSKYCINNDEVHLWICSVKPSNQFIRNYIHVLTDKELEKASSFLTNELKNKFIMTRGTLRYILSYYLKLEPQSIVFDTNSYGKPFIPKEQNTIALEFNLSHSYNISICAIRSGKLIGADIEYIKPFESMREVARSHFTEIEYKKLIACSPSLFTISFYKLWTRKESYIKAIGKGLSYSLADFEVSFLSHEKPRLIHIHNSSIEASFWEMKSFNISSNYIGAITTLFPIKKFQTYYWKHSNILRFNHCKINRY